MLIIAPEVLSKTEPRGDTSSDRRRNRPRISIVSVAHDGSSGALRRVTEHCRRWERFGVEVVLVCAAPHTATFPSAPVWTGLRCIQAPADATEPQLRRLGFAAASGDVIMLVHDLFSADDAWIEHVCAMGTRDDRGPRRTPERDRVMAGEP